MEVFARYKFLDVNGVEVFRHGWHGDLVIMPGGYEGAEISFTNGVRARTLSAKYDQVGPHFFEAFVTAVVQ